MTGRWVYPLDPECPAVVRFRESLDDPITVAASIDDELTDAFERNHRGRCDRCREYAVANVDVEL